MSNVCSERGWLGPARTPIPRDPGTHYAVGMPKIVLCNHLLCSACGAEVRSINGVQVVGGPGVLDAAYEADDPRTVDGVKDGLEGYRLYLCRCAYFSCGTPIGLSTGDSMPELGLPSSWGCGGHPAHGLPITVEGRTIPAKVDWRSLVESLFREPRPPGAHLLWAVKWLRAARAELEGTDGRDSLDAVIDSLLDSDDPVLGGHAIHFLWYPGDSSAIDRLPELWDTRDEWLRESADPMGLVDLEDVLVRTIAAHLDWGRWPDDSGLRNRLRNYALQPERLDGVGWFLARHDGAWFRENYERLVEASPATQAKAARWLAQLR